MSKNYYGTYLDLNDSDYFVDIGDLRYYFSTEFNRDRFSERYIENRGKIRVSLTNRFGVKFSADEVADLRLYRSIEKRGFRVDKGGEPLCNGNLEYVTVLKTNES